MWICKHGALERFGADPKFCQPFFKSVLSIHVIELKTKLSWASQKNGKLELNNIVYKTNLERAINESGNDNLSTQI